jgi:hypothetical protein
MKEWRERNPLKAYFNWLKRSADKRGIAFSLTLQQFARWCEKTSYLELVGRGDAMSCDRKNPERGYEPGNIRLLSYRENARLGALHAWKRRKAA